ncbi:uncharacterized protein LOC118751843 [Rhagoletis pomonella]|uniref:uncharacterized protein LOC118751843 n=1 Tax=Rhagoletis pomonella TaxID=28610 RepID=UPI00177EC9F6|nr:uncharacterized protein LOC118751843 [Rhagoletis pomonella]
MKRMRIISSDSSDSSDSGDVPAPPAKSTEQKLNTLLERLDTIDKTQEKILNVLNRLTEEVIVLKRELMRSKKASTETIEIVPKEVMCSLSEFQEFEEKLQNHDQFNHLVQDLKNIAASNGEQFVRKCWNALLSDELALQFSWMGTAEKKPVRHLITTAAIRKAFQQKFNESVEIMERITKRYFHYAGDRISKRIKRNVSQSSA